MRGDVAGGPPVWTVPHQQSKYPQAIFMGEGGEGRHAVGFVHYSTIVELSNGHNRLDGRAV